MRDRKEFAEVVCKKVAELMEDKEVFVNEKHCNNGGIQYQITIKDGERNISPSISISPDEDIVAREAARIVEVYQASTVNDVDTGSIMSAENLMKNSFVALVNAEKNREFLESQGTVMFDYLDLLGVVRCRVPLKDSNGSFAVRESILEVAGIDKEDLIEAAKKNTEEGMGFTSMAQMMIAMGMPEFMVGNVDCGMMVGTNEGKYYGAAIMLYAEKFKEIADKLDSDLFILPSSIHECIAIPYEDGKQNEFRNMVMEVNGTQVAEDERLSDSVYIFSRETGELKVA